MSRTDRQQREQAVRKRVQQALEAGTGALTEVSRSKPEEQKQIRDERQLLVAVERYGGTAGRQWIEESCRGLQADSGRLRGRIQSLLRAHATLSGGMKAVTTALEESKGTEDPEKVMLALKEITKVAERRRLTLKREKTMIDEIERLATASKAGSPGRDGARRAIEIARVTRVVLESSPERQREALSYRAVTKRLGGQATQEWTRQGIAELEVLAAMAASALMTRAEADRVSPELRNVVQALSIASTGRAALATYAKRMEKDSPEMACWIRTGRYPEEEEPVVPGNTALEREGQAHANEALAGLMLLDVSRLTSDEVLKAGRSAQLAVVGRKGDHTTYDSRLHKPVAGGMLDGEPCTIVRPAVERVSGEERPERIVKAIVERTQQET